jgi:CheY-like chemotaxis protein
VAEAVGSPCPRRSPGSGSSSWRTTNDSREILAHALTLEGATVTAVSAAREALARLPKADIVLTDLAMPGDDGVWLLEQVNQQSRPSRSSRSAATTRARSRAWRQRPSPASCSSRSTSIKCVPRSPPSWATEHDRPRARHQRVLPGTPPPRRPGRRPRWRGRLDRLRLRGRHGEAGGRGRPSRAAHLT